MTRATPADYEQVRVPYHQLGVGDEIEVEPGILEKIAGEGMLRTSETFVITASGRIRVGGYGLKN